MIDYEIFKKKRVFLLKITQKSHIFIPPFCHYFQADRTRYSYSTPHLDAIYAKKSRSTQNGHEPPIIYHTTIKILEYCDMSFFLSCEFD